MFKNNFVVSIKSNGKFFKENEDDIHVPFNTEYSIYLKNLESRDAVVNVNIDGKDVLDGKRLIVRGNSVLELEGFMDGQTAKNKFRFIKRSKDIEEFRGITPEDGIISVTFDFEKRNPEYYPYTIYYPDWKWYPSQPYYGSPTWTVATYGSPSGTFVSSNDQVGVTKTIQSGRGTSNSVMSLNSQVSEGISVPGNDISQNFGLGYVGNLENNPTTISFKLFGFDDNTQQNKVVFTKDRLTCSSCGLQSKNNNKFCPRCGTRLLGE